MANPWETAPPQTVPAPHAEPKPWETNAPADQSQPADHSDIDRYLKNAPGVTAAQNPLEALHAGFQMSSSGLLMGRPDLTLPQNASFYQKLMYGLGQGGGDLPFNIVGGVAGGLAGGAVTAEAGGVGAVPGAGAGGMALPEAVRQVMLDRYEANKNRTWGEFAHDLAARSWEVGKAAFTGAIVGPAAGKAGAVAEGVTGSAFAKTAATVTTYGVGATAVHSALSGRVPNAEDFTLGMVQAVGFHAAGSYVGGKFVTSDIGVRVKANMQEIYRSTGIPPWQQAEQARRDPKFREEVFGSDVNGDPSAPRFNAARPPDPEPFMKPMQPEASPAAPAGMTETQGSRFDYRFGNNGIVSGKIMPDGYKIKVAHNPEWETSRGQGFAAYKNLADYALGQGKVLYSDASVTAPAARVYDKLKAAGYTVERNPLADNDTEGTHFVPNRGTDNWVYRVTKGPENATGTFKTNAFKVQDEHAQETQDIHSAAYRGMAIDTMLRKVRGLERSGDDAISPAGAIGRYQIMPGTARQYGFDPSRLTDPVYNEKVARVVLNDLHLRFKGDEEAILIAYNAGPRRAIAFVNNGRDQSELPHETQGYLQRAGFGGGGAGKPPGGGKPTATPEPEEGPTGPDFSRMTTESRLSRYMDRIGEPPRSSEGLWSLSRLTRQWVSELQTAREIDGEMVRQGLLDPKDKNQLNTEDMFRQTYASDARSSHFFMRGAIDPVTFEQKPGPALNDVIQEIKNVGGNLDEFNLYRVSLRTIEKERQGVNVGVIPGGIKEAQINAQDPNLAKYAKANDMMQEWKKGGLEYGRDSGLFSQEQMDRMTAANTSHVSLRRVMGDDSSFKQGSFGRAFRVRNPLKQMEGSDRQIVQPMTADMDNLRQIVAMADRNRAIGHLVGSADARDVLGLKKLAAPEAKAMLAEPGSNVFKPYNMSEADAKAFEPFVAKAASKKLSDNQFVFFNKGKAEVWEAQSPEVAQLMRGADSPGEANLILKVAAWPAQMMRAGTVFMPDFAFRVGAANELSAFILDPSHPTPFLTFTRGMLEPWKQGDTFWEWIRHGGGGVALQDLDKTYIQRNMQQVLDTTGADRSMWNTVKHPIQMAQIVNERFDTAPRIGLYKTLVSQGVDKAKAAMISRRASLDYAERGTSNLANTMSKTIPFFRASLLGMRQMATGFQRDPVGVLTRIGIASIAPSVLFWALNHEADKHLDDQDKYSAVSRDLKDMYFVTPPIDGVRFKMRRPFQVGFTGALIDRFLDAQFEKDPHAMDDWAHTIIQENIPPMMPSLVLPIIEGETNHNFFTGKALIPDSLKDATPDMQYSDYTSEVAKRVSAILGDHQGLGLTEVSPIVLDNYVREWGGAMGSQLLHALDVPMGKEKMKPEFDVADLPFVSGFVLRHPNMNNQVVSDFYTDAEKFEALHQNKVLEIRQGNIEAAERDYVNGGNKVATIERIRHCLSVQRRALKAVMQNDQLDTDEKRQLSERIYSDAIQIAKFGSRILGGYVPSEEEAGALGDRLQKNIEASGIVEQGEALTQKAQQ